jgi:hypothetical protein
VTFAARPHLPAASGGAGLPLGTMYLQYESLNEAVEPDTVTLTLNTNGTFGIAHDFEYQNAETVPNNWYAPTTTGIGSSYQVRFTLLSGAAWDTGLTSGVAYALSSARSIAYTAQYGDANKIASVKLEILTAGGDVYAEGTLAVDIYNGVFD